MDWWFRLDGLLRPKPQHTIYIYIYIYNWAHQYKMGIDQIWTYIQALNDNSCPFVSLLIYIYSVSLFVFHETENKKIEAANKTKQNQKPGTLCGYFALRHLLNVEQQRKQSSNNRNLRKFRNASNWMVKIFRFCSVLFALMCVFITICISKAYEFIPVG